MGKTPATPSVGQALAWAFQRLAEEWSTVRILSALLVAVMLVALWPLYGYYLELFSALSESPVNLAKYQAIEASDLATIFAIIVSAAGASAIFVLMSRLTDLDHSALLEGGFIGLRKRALWVAWRLAGAFGFIAVMAIAMMMITIFALIALGAVGSHTWPGTGGWVSLILVGTIALFAGIFMVFMAVLGALSISIYAASRDLRVGIFETWEALEGSQWHLVLANIYLYLALVLAMGLAALLSGAFFEVIGGLALVIFVVLSSSIGGVYAFLWLTMGAAFANTALSQRNQPT